MYDDKVLATLIKFGAFNVINDRFPHIGKKITFLWGYKELVIYAKNLLNENRDGNRQGFPPEVGAALVNLLYIHDKLFPQFIDKPDAWCYSV